MKNVTKTTRKRMDTAKETSEVLVLSKPSEVFFFGLFSAVMRAVERTLEVVHVPHLNQYTFCFLYMFGA